MKNLQLKEFINNQYFLNGKPQNKFSNQKYYSKFPELIEFNKDVLLLTSFLDDLNPTFAFRCYCILQDIYTIPKCYCGNRVKQNWNVKEHSLKPFNTFCSIKCSRNSDETKKKQVETCIKKYGTSNPSKTEKIKDKIVRKNRLSFDNVVSRAKHHYGDRFSYYEKEGSIYIYCKEHEYEFKIKHRKDLLNGKTNCPICRKEKLSKQYIMSEEAFKTRLLDIKGDQIDLLSSYSGMHIETEFSCKEHGKFIKKPYQLLQDQNCPYCYSGTSKQEKSVLSFLETIYKDNILSNDRTILKGKEIDFIIENNMYEYNGLYWHSDEFIDKSYHLVKTELAEENGYKLFHIWSHEWLNNIKREIWESIIKNSLGLSYKIYARKCEIIELENDVYKHFLNFNHLQGYISAKYRYGLVYQNELVAVMSFSKPRFNNHYDYELIRYCNKLGVSVVGGASKLFSHFRNLYNGSVISYADRRISNGNLYKQLGFDFLHNTQPNYFYTKDFINTFSRYQCQKHKLQSFLSEYDDNKSEYGNMKQNGYYRIYDCGNSVWISKCH